MYIYGYIDMSCTSLSVRGRGALANGSRRAPKWEHIVFYNCLHAYHKWPDSSALQYKSSAWKVRFCPAMSSGTKNLSTLFACGLYKSESVNFPGGFWRRARGGSPAAWHAAAAAIRCEFTTPTCSFTGRGSVGYGSADYGSGG